MTTQPPHDSHQPRHKTAHTAIRVRNTGHVHCGDVIGSGAVPSTSGTSPDKAVPTRAQHPPGPASHRHASDVGERAPHERGTGAHTSARAHTFGLVL